MPAKPGTVEFYADMAMSQVDRYLGLADEHGQYEAVRKVLIERLRLRKHDRRSQRERGEADE